MADRKEEEEAELPESGMVMSPLSVSSGPLAREQAAHANTDKNVQI
jgi:hypothetical protein